MKKQAKKTTKRTLVKKVAVKKAIVKKRKQVAIAKKAVSKKKVKFFKPLGIISAIGGALGLVLLISFSLANLLAPNIIDDNTVLGATTGLIAPTGFSAKVTNFRVSLSWDNMAEGNGQYLVWIYNSNAKKYYPEALVDGTGATGGIITRSYDQAPGTTLLYRVSMCEDCQFTGENTVSGSVGSMSAGVAVTMPRLSTPKINSVTSVDGGLKISWGAKSGIDGYDIWRTTSPLRSYTKIGSVGTDGTYSSWHTYNADGTPAIPIDVPSPTSYIDKTVVPGKLYFYKVSAKKMITPLTYEKGWQNFESNRSGFKMVVPIIRPPVGLKVEAAYKDIVYISISSSQEATDLTYIYCDKCASKKMLLNVKTPGISFGGVAFDSSTVSYVLSGLKANTRYTFSATKARVIAGKAYESQKTKTQTIKTPNIDQPAMPTGLQPGGMSEETGLRIIWDDPLVAVDGYSITAVCNNSTDKIFYEDIAFASTWLDENNKRAFDIGSTFMAAGECSVNLTAYQISNGIKVKSNTSLSKFINGV